MTKTGKGDISAQRKRYRQLHPDRARGDVKGQKARYKKAYPEKNRAAVRRSLIRLRQEVLSHYSNGTPVCAQCGESCIEFLEIDHINGGGKQHRREIKGDLCRWIKDNGYPDGFQILCSNCNTKKVKIASKKRGTAGNKTQRKTYRRDLKRKMKVFEHYAIEGKIKCACCGADDIDVLCTDHINGDGAAHRESAGSLKNKMYLWIIRNNYPRSSGSSAQTVTRQSGNTATARTTQTLQPLQAPRTSQLPNPLRILQQNAAMGFCRIHSNYILHDFAMV